MNFKEYFQLYLEAFENLNNFLLNPNNDNKTLLELEQEFKENGGEILGEGAYGKVYFHPKWNYVLKTFLSDTCYTRFARYAYRNKSPNLPVLYGQPQRITPNYHRAWVSDRIYVIRMEKLETLYTDSVAMNQYDEFNRTRSIYYNTNNIEERDEIIKNITNDNTKELFSTFLKMVKEFDSTQCHTDLHSFNVMVRPSTGDLVITDPYAKDGDISQGKDPINKWGYLKHNIERKNAPSVFYSTDNTLAISRDKLMISGGKRTPAKQKRTGVKFI